MVYKTFPGAESLDLKRRNLVSIFWQQWGYSPNWGYVMID